METEERESLEQCKCGKMLCPAPGNQSPGSRWSCYDHPQFGFSVNESPGRIPAHHQDGTGDCEFDFKPVYLERRKKDDGGRPGDGKERRLSTKCGCGKWNCSGDKHAGEEMQVPTCQHIIMGSHHTDATTACETNHRSPEAEEQWREEHAKWKAAQAKLPDLAAVLHLLDAQANPLSFDGHDNYMFVVDNPEAAAICIHHMYDTLQGIQVGQKALAELPPLKDR